MASKGSMISSFIESAPPGELSDVVADIQGLTSHDPSLLQSQDSAFQKYNEEQLVTVRIPGASNEVIISKHNSLGGGKYHCTESQQAFSLDHRNQKPSDVESHSLETKHIDIISSLIKAYSAHAAEHFPSYSVGVFPTDNDGAIALLLVANKYSPNNFWNGRWRSQYTYNPTNNSITGAIKVDVHYYEDGNVRLLTDKQVTASATSSSAADVVKQIAAAEKKYQEDLNRAFGNLSEGAFKGLRRQLPVTRQKVEWEKIGGYRLGQDIGGGRSK